MKKAAFRGGFLLVDDIGFICGHGP
ncbi:hypothetical protein N509_01473, partial [Brucella abortus BC95]